MLERGIYKPKVLTYIPFAINQYVRQNQFHLYLNFIIFGG